MCVYIYCITYIRQLFLNNFFIVARYPSSSNKTNTSNFLFNKRVLYKIICLRYTCNTIVFLCQRETKLKNMIKMSVKIFKYVQLHAYCLYKMFSFNGENIYLEFSPFSMEQPSLSWYRLINSKIYWIIMRLWRYQWLALQYAHTCCIDNSRFRQKRVKNNNCDFQFLKLTN